MHGALVSMRNSNIGFLLGWRSDRGQLSVYLIHRIIGEFVKKPSVDDYKFLATALNSPRISWVTGIRFSHFFSFAIMNTIFISSAFYVFTILVISMW